MIWFGRSINSSFILRLISEGIVCLSLHLLNSPIKSPPYNNIFIRWLLKVVNAYKYSITITLYHNTTPWYWRVNAAAYFLEPCYPLCSKVFFCCQLLNRAGG